LLTIDIPVEKDSILMKVGKVLRDGREVATDSVEYDSLSERIHYLLSEQ
jgi:hypothetical protein